ncbi:M48 family metallopeptidase [Prosthecochloris sp. HL-130-GSB]|uniref:M48 family peptidase n=1 Tax=Prosthecochloris aestuarii TaxID=1102 RepID=A0A831WRF4_PROAE|nr:M48 family metallopeptidase [Prosthecochloris sp. HL-130-GSB]ARM30593.1 peptidase M48 [Prosthecochloris sp. HL-130-GSB]MBO8093253.1 M48 family metallopeptidase [Prosthecochloris sp.]HED30760.1 M48 family peptidase [Prosthecochloris aestuarii]
MNIFGVVILVTLVGTFVLKMVSDILNLRSASSALPDEFRGVYDQGAYEKSQRYLHSNTRFSMITAVFDLAVLLAFWFSGGFDYIDQLIRGWGLSPVLAGLAFIGILLLLQGVLSLPFSMYRTFVIEERFGFNKTTPATFFADMIKSLLLGVALGGPVIAALLWFFEHSGTMAWLWAWIGVSLFSLLLQYVAPTLIMPLFNKFTPLEDGELKSAIMSYAREVNFPLEGIYVIDGSRRSAKANAFFTGFGRQKRIALFDTLIEQHSSDELVAVLAHEIGHYKKKHILISMLLNTLNMGVVFFLLSLFMDNRLLFDAFYMTSTSVYASLVFFLLLYSPVEFLLSIALQYLSRKHEYEADQYAVTTFRHGSALIGALKKLSRSNLSNLTPHPLYVFLNYSHPPVLQRIDRMRSALS